jgi:hypothetical protein
MPQSAPAQPSPSLSSFAGLLASFAAPPPSLPSDADDDAPLWSSRDLGQDVATLTYERALRTHARYRPADREFARDADRVGGSIDRSVGASINGSIHGSVDGSATDPGSAARADASGEFDAVGAFRAAGDFRAAGALDVARAAAAVGTAPGLQMGTARESDLRSASVTIRLSRMECAQLHQRAAEAGLTLSAYLRSCAVEAEGLRAQVKQALAEIKAQNKLPGPALAASRESRQAASHPGKEQGNEKSERQNFFTWIRRMLQRGH